MAERTAVISLKGDGSTWRGQTKQTLLSRGDFRFRDLVNCYVSPDGTELRRFPGFKTVTNFDYEREFTDSFRVDTPLASPPVTEQIVTFSRLVSLHGMKLCRGKLVIVGESDFRKERLRVPTGSPPTNQEVQITGYTISGSVATINYSGGSLVGKLFHYEWVWIEGTGEPLIDDQVLMVNSPPGATAFAVLLGSSGSGSASNLNGTVWRVREDAENQDPDCLTIWTVEDQPDVDAVNINVFPSQVANRQRDWGEVIGEFIEGYSSGGGSPPAWPMTVQRGISRRKQRAIPRRASLETAGDRVVIAAPGYGCVFQAPIVIPTKVTGSGIGGEYNSYRDRPRCLGLPKGVLFDGDGAFASAASPPQSPGTYRFRVAYKDEYTGEVGLASEEITITIPQGSPPTLDGMQLWILHPGYLMGETLAFTAQVFASDVGGVALGLLYEVRIPEHGIDTNFGDLQYDEIFFRLQLPNFTVSDIDFTQAPPVGIRQMPMGAKTARSVRGYLWMGGAIGDTGRRKELQSIELNSIFLGENDNDYKNVDEASVFAIQLQGEQQTPRIAGASGIPPAYSGTPVFSDTDLFDNATYEVGELYPPPAKVKLFDKLINCYGDHLSAAIHPWAFRYEMDGQIHRFDITRSIPDGQFKLAHLLLPRGQVWFGEQGNPGTVLGTNRDFLDATEEEDVEGIGRLGNNAIFCTRDRTYAIAWGNSPLSSDPRLLSSEHGCIAYNSMVEFDGGLAWLGERGPVAMLSGGAPVWVGQEMEGDFVGRPSRFLRDDSGAMPHAWACHDPERGLVYFGLRSDRIAHTYKDNDYANSSDENRSKFPCDEVLVWSYRSNAWSTWLPPFGIYWMERVDCADDVNRIAFLADDSRVYVLDDAYHDTNKDPLVGTAAVGSGPLGFAQFRSTVAFANNPDVPIVGRLDPFNNDTAVRKNMEYVIYDPSTFEVKGTGTVLAAVSQGSPPAHTIVFLNESQVWKEGDKILIGWQSMTVRMNSESFGPTKRPSRIGKGGIRFSLHSLYAIGQTGPLGEAPHAWVRARVTSERGTRKLHPKNYRHLGSNAGEAIDKRFERGAVRGQELALELLFIGGQQIRIKDIEVELASAGP